MLYKYRVDELLDPVTNREDGWRLVVPLEHRERVLSDAHDAPSAGHLGIEKTYDRVARQYYWPGIYQDVRTYVTTCETCQKHKVSQEGPQGLMGRRNVERPWAVVAVDTMEFPASKNQYKYLVVFQDLFTKWVEVKPLRSATGQAVARALEELILFRWEAPQYLLSDNGKEYDNKYLNDVLNEYGVTHITTPPYHPQANPVERANRTLKTMIRAYLENDHRDWDKHLHEIRHAMNTAIQASLKTSPAFLNYGRHPNPVKSLRREVEQREPLHRLDPKEWVDRVKRLDALRDLVSLHAEQAQDRQANAYDKGRRKVQFNVGDQVLRKVQVLSRGHDRFAAKLAPRYEGPYTISAKKSDLVYILDTGNARRNNTAHISQLKRYLPPRKPTLPH